MDCSVVTYYIQLVGLLYVLSDRVIPVEQSVGVSLLLVVAAGCVCTCPSSKLAWLSRDVASLTWPVYGDELSITGAPSVKASV